MSTITTAPPVAEAGVRLPRPGRRASRTGFSVRKRAFIWAARLVLIAGFLLLWEAAARSHWFNPALFGQPTGIVKAMRDYIPSQHGLASLGSTMSAVGLSFVIGSVTGTIAGLALGLSPTLNAILGPFITPLNSIPRIALAPLFIAWFGLTLSAKVGLAVSIVFFILTENARSAVRSVDSDLMTMARVVGLGSIPLLFRVVLPSAVPTLFAGLRLTFTYSLLGVIASEMIAATAGFGQDIVLYSSSYQMNTTFAIIVELVVIAVVANWGFASAERRLLRWQG